MLHFGYWSYMLDPFSFEKGVCVVSAKYVDYSLAVYSLQ